MLGNQSLFLDQTHELRIILNTQVLFFSIHVPSGLIAHRSLLYNTVLSYIIKNMHTNHDTNNDRNVELSEGWLDFINPHLINFSSEIIKFITNFYKIHCKEVFGFLKIYVEVKPSIREFVSMLQ